jgi:hypothetical protein
MLSGDYELVLHVFHTLDVAAGFSSSCLTRVQVGVVPSGVLPDCYDMD